MRKKITLLTGCIVLSLLCNLHAWGQVSWSGGNGSDGHTTETVGAYSFAPENNFGAGETGIITPYGSSVAAGLGALYQVWSPYAAQWSGNMGTFNLDAMNLGNGRITIGEPSVTNANTVATWNQTNGLSSSTTCSCSSANVTNTVSAAPRPTVPDGSGTVQLAGASYATNTTVTVNGNSKTAYDPWLLEQIFFYDVHWRYNRYDFSLNTAHSEAVPNGSGSPGPPSCTCCRTCNSSHSTIHVAQQNLAGTGVVNGLVVISAGSHINLDNPGVSVGASLASSTATLTLPDGHHTLMLNGSLDEASFVGASAVEWSATTPTTLGVNAVLGINGNYLPKTRIITNAGGGTVLLGANTGGQSAIRITPPTGASSVGVSFQSDGVVRTRKAGVMDSSYYRNIAGNLGNYGTNNVKITHAATMFTNTGSAGLQIFNRSANCGSSSLDFDGTAVNITNGTGNLLIDARGATDFRNASTFTATVANAGHTTIRGGSRVYFNGPHAYTGSQASNYWVHAIGNTSYNGVSYCPVGDILTTAAAPVVVSNNGGTGALKWEAYHDINTKGTVDFDADNVTPIDWIALNDIHTENFVHFIHTGSGPTKWYAGHSIRTDEGVYFNHNGANATGTTHWYAVQDITTNDTVRFDHSTTPTTAANAWIKMEAVRGDITANNKFYLTMNNPSRASILATNINHADSGNISFGDSLNILRMSNTTTTSMTEIIAGTDIHTAMVDYESLNTTGDSMQVISRMGDIWLGYNNLPPDTGTPRNNNPLAYSYDINRFVYKIPVTTEGKLLIRAGDDDPGLGAQTNGGNIYFTHINENLASGGLYNTEVSIPFSNWYNCNTTWKTQADYEMAGIIGGVARCQLSNAILPPFQCKDTGLIYRGFNGELLFDAGRRGNIIINNGSYLTFQGGTGNSKFLTRWGDIDMRYPFDVDSMAGSLLFLAQYDSTNRLNTGECGCEEKRNNVYLQDFQYRPVQQSGSIFVGADNNIKLQYGGLRRNVWMGSQRDPFYNDTPYPCDSTTYHCDSDTSKNQARDLILNFHQDAAAADIQSGGFAAVASDLIDVYKNMIYNGGKGSGLSAVPGYGSLHGESVAGYGLFIKTQADKDNWNLADYQINHQTDPTLGAACDDDQCNQKSYLHQVARVTFHADARIYTEDQRSYIASPVLEAYGNLDLNTHLRKGGKTSIQIRTDSLIAHDSLIIDGKLTTFSSWSGLRRDMPIIKLGHQRFTPPFVEDGNYCAPCYTHLKKDGEISARTALDTVFVTFRNDATIERLHTLVADHAVISFLTDSFDHVQGNPTLNAAFYADTFKVRNHVELFGSADHTHDGHFELVSEAQMHSKEYAGIYSRHLHMEPIAPSCAKDFKYSQFWTMMPALNVITTSAFGGFGWIHSDVHVEIGAQLSPGYASLRHDGNCYEQKAGILKMEDLRLDKKAEMNFSIGDSISPFVIKYGCSPDKQYMLGGYADLLDVDSLSIYGESSIRVFVRPEGIDLAYGETRCFPIIRYKGVGKENLNNLKLAKSTLTSKDHKTIDGTYYLALDFDTICNVVNLCVSTTPNPVYHRPVYMPSVQGVITEPGPGTYYVASGSDFLFKATYSTEQPLKVTTGRTIQGKDEEIWGWKNPNGEYEYVIRSIRQEIKLVIGPEFASPDTITGISKQPLAGAAVWSNDQTLYIRVPKEDIASIYSIAGQLVRRVDLPEGETPIAIQRGAYVVTLKDGSVYKVIVK